MGQLDNSPEVSFVISADKVELFVRLMTRYQPRVYLFILSLLPNRADADEVL